MEHYCIFEVLINSANYRFVSEFDNHDEAVESLDSLNDFFCPPSCYYVLRKLDDSEFADISNYNPYNYVHKVR